MMKGCPQRRGAPWWKAHIPVGWLWKEGCMLCVVAGLDGCLLQGWRFAMMLAHTGMVQDLWLSAGILAQWASELQCFWADPAHWAVQLVCLLTLPVHQR